MNLDVIAHNLANVNTAGFKRSEVSFEDLLYVTLRTPGAVDASGNTSAAGLQIGSGAAAVATTAQHTQGTIEPTGRDLDVAIDGEGFFLVTTASGDQLFTRTGSFKFDSDRNIVTAEGYSLGLSTVQADADQIQIQSDGTVLARVPGATTTFQDLGTLQLYRFANPSGLEAVGGNYYKEMPSSGTATAANPGDNGAGRLKAGYLERSNVDVVSELIRMIMAQRAYEVNSRAIKAGDEMLSVSSRLGG
jgi:flagellar basal-body rod protein FlgG